MPSCYALAALSCQPHFVILVNQMIEKYATPLQPEEMKAIHLTGKWLLQKFVGGSAHHIPIPNIKTEKDLNVLCAVSKFMYGCGKEPRKKFEQIEFISYAKTNSAYESIVRLMHTTSGKQEDLFRIEFPFAVKVPKWSKQWELNQPVEVDDSIYEQLNTLQVLMLNSPSAIIALLRYKYSRSGSYKAETVRMCDAAIYVINKQETERIFRTGRILIAPPLLHVAGATLWSAVLGENEVVDWLLHLLGIHHGCARRKARTGRRSIQNLCTRQSYVSEPKSYDNTSTHLSD